MQLETYRADVGPIRENQVKAKGRQTHEVAAIIFKPVYAAVGNCKDPSREVKQQQDLLKDDFNQVVALAGQQKRI